MLTSSQVECALNKNLLIWQSLVNCLQTSYAPCDSQQAVTQHKFGVLCVNPASRVWAMLGRQCTINIWGKPCLEIVTLVTYQNVLDRFTV